MGKSTGQVAVALARRLKWRMMQLFCLACYALQEHSAVALGLYYKSLNTCCAIGWDLYGKPSQRNHDNVWESWIQDNPPVTNATLSEGK